MPRRIPRLIQEKVIAKWLEGKSRDQIARELKISTGSTSSIIEERRKKYSKFDLLRILAIKLREINLDVYSFAPFVRLRELILSEYVDSGKRNEEIDEHVESLMESLCVYCFNQGRSVEEFGNMVHDIYLAANKFGIGLADLPDYVKGLADRASTLRDEITLLKRTKQRILNDYLITMDTIEDILSNGPNMLGAYLKMKYQLRETKKELDRARIELFNSKVEIYDLRRHRCKEKVTCDRCLRSINMDKAN